MRFEKFDLLGDVVSSYDQTKTTIQGRVYSKTVDGKTALGPPLNKFIDIQTDSGITLSANNTFLTSNNRLFVLGAEAGAATPLLCYSFTPSTGQSTYIGRVNIAMPDTAATTTVYRSLKVIDSGTTGWKVFITTTATPLINGGTISVNKLDLADFVQVGFPSIPFATGNDQKAVYFHQDSSAIGVNHVQTASAGSVLDSANNKLYVHNGIAATHQYYVFNTNTAPTYSTNSVTGVAATDVISDTGHPYVDNDPIVFTSITGGAGITVGTIYFVRSSVAGVSYQISTTTGGAALNFTSDISAGSVGRGFGTTSSNFSHKTGNLPALTGTLLLTDSEKFATPAHTANSGFDCAFFSTTTNMYLGKLSELTAGATTWPSLITVNLLGTANQITTPTATYATWSNDLDRAIYSTGLVFVIKQFVNSSIETIFGGTNNKYFEALVGNEVVEFQPAAAITSMSNQFGWLLITNTTAGQRGVMAVDLRSDASFDYSYIVTKVLSTPAAVYEFITTVDALFDYTGSLSVYYRTSGFGSISGGWTAIDFASLLNSFSAGEQVQFKILFSTLGLDTSIHAQLCDFYLGYSSLTDSSSHWELSVDDSSNGNPSETVFRLKSVYPTSVGTLYYRAYDLTNVLIVNHNTSANAARFTYSTDSGASWLSGTIPNTVGTLVKYTFLTPPGVDIRPSLRDS